MIKPEIVQKALDMIKKRAANYEYFFERLDSPAWIDPLFEKGFFKKPPPVEQTGDYNRFPLWPESQYLARMARIPEAQQRVLEIALNIPDTDNTRVNEDLADIALSLPANMAACFVPKAKGWLKAPHPLLLPEKLGALIAHLVKGGEDDAALNLARAVLAVVPDRAPTQDEGDDEIFRPSPRPRPRFDEWNYEEILRKDFPLLLETTGERALDVLCDILSAAVRISGRIEKEGASRDYSYSWRPAIENHEQNHPHEIKDHLVTAVRDAAEHLVRRNPEKVAHLVTRLEAEGWPVFHRIALHLLRCFPDAAHHLIAERLTDRNRFENTDLHHEYVLLARDCFGRLDKEGQEEILDWIEKGPDLEEWREYWGKATGKIPPDLDEQRYKRVWQRDRLAPLADVLPADWKLYYNELIQELGPAEHPEFLAYSEGGWVGPTSPKSLEELRSMNTDELLAYLRTWFPSGDWRSPTPEGLGRVLTEVVAADPEPYAEAAPHFQGIDPTYVRALLSGLRDAARNKRTFVWEPVVQLAQWVVKQDREIPGRNSEYADHDPGWVWTRKAIADLLSAAFEDGPAEIPIHLREQVWAVLQPLTDDPDPTPEHEARYGGSNMDPATLSINTTRGEAMHAVVRYALWVRRHLEKLPDGLPRLERGFDEIPEVRDVLEIHLNPDRDPSLAVRSVYGQWFPWLALLDARWAADHKGHIFPTDPDRAGLREAAWETYVVFCKPYNAVFDVLRDEYGRAIEHIGSPTDDHRHLRDPDERLAEHLMELYWRGRLALNEPGGLLDRFYAKADDTLRGHAMDFVGRSLMNTEDKVPGQVINRLKALWEYRLATARAAVSTGGVFTEELSAFGWWFASGKFDLEWALPQLIAVLRLVHKAEPDHLVAERLAELASAYPLEAVQCLSNMLHEDREGWRVISVKDELRLVLSTAIQGDNPRAKSVAEEMIHRLGARGYKEFRDLLKPAIPHEGSE